MSAIVADAGAKVVADGAGGSFLGVGSTHGIAPLENGAFGFEDQGENSAGTHKVGEFAEERALFVDGIKATGFFSGQAHGFDGDNFEARFVNSCKDFTLLAAADGVGLDDCESTFDCHENFLQETIVNYPSRHPTQWDQPKKWERTEVCPTKSCYFNAAAKVEPRSAGVSTVWIPAAAMAAYLSLAVP